MPALQRLNALPNNFRVKAASATNWASAFSGTTTMDGIVLAAGDRVLLPAQNDSTTDGIWQINAGAWTRPVDADTATKIAGAYVTVERGTVSGGKTYRTTMRASDTLGVTATNWYDVNDAAHLVSGTLALARLPVAASGVNDATSLVRADDARINRAEANLYREIVTNTQIVSPTAAWTAFPTGTEKTALSLAFTKAAGDLHAIMNASPGQSSGTNAIVRMGLRFTATVGGLVTDFDIGRGVIVASPGYINIAGNRRLTGLAAGAYTVEPIFRTNVASTLEFQSTYTTIAFNLRQVS